MRISHESTPVKETDPLSQILLTIILIRITLVSSHKTRQEILVYVCLCNGITDTQIRNAIHKGATSFKDVRSLLGVASQCGKCGILTQDILRETLRDDSNNEDLFYAIS